MNNTDKRLEAVARAICLAEGGNPDFTIDGESAEWVGYSDAAQAAIEAHDIAYSQAYNIMQERIAKLSEAYREASTGLFQQNESLKAVIEEGGMTPARKIDLQHHVKRGEEFHARAKAAALANPPKEPA